MFALAIIFERLIALQSKKVLPEGALEQAMNCTRQGFPSDSTIQIIAQLGSVGPVFAAGLQTLANNPSADHQDVRESMEMEGRMSAQNLERYLTALATLASAAPLLGLLGTVIGRQPGAVGPRHFSGALQHGHGFAGGHPLFDGLAIFQGKS